MEQVSTISVRGDKIKRCTICGAPVSFVNNRILYGESKGVWPYIYLCKRKKCGAYIGCQPNTDVPLGTMADAITRRARQYTHKVFDQLWKKRIMKRREAYAWLANELGISKNKCHIGMFSTEQCEHAIRAVNQSGFLKGDGHEKAME